MQDSLQQAQERFRGLTAALSRPLCICRATGRANAILPLESLVYALRHLEPASGGQQIDLDLDGRTGALQSLKFTILGSNNAINWATISADDWPGVSNANPQEMAEINAYIPFRLMPFIDDFNFLEICFASTNDPADEIKDMFTSTSLLKAAVFIPNENGNQDLERFQLYSDIFKVFLLPTQFIDQIKKKQSEGKYEIQKEYKVFNEKYDYKLSDHALCTLNNVFKEIINMYVAILKDAIYEHALTYRVITKQLKYKNLSEQQQHIVQYLQNNYSETVLIRLAKLLIFHIKAKDHVADFIIQILTDYITKFSKNSINASNIAFFLRALICMNNYIDCDNDQTITEFRSGIVFQIFYDAKSMLLQTNNELSLLKKKFKGNWSTNIQLLNKPLIEIFSPDLQNILDTTQQDVSKYTYMRNLNFKIFAEIFYVIIYSHLYQQEYLPRQVQFISPAESCQDLIYLLTKKDMPENSFLKQIYFINAYFWFKEYDRQKIKQCIMLGIQIWQSMIKNLLQKSNKSKLSGTYIKFIENFGNCVEIPSIFTKFDPVYQLFITCKLQTQLLAYQNISSDQQIQKSQEEQFNQLMQQLIHQYLYQNEASIINKGSNNEMSAYYFDKKLLQDFILKNSNKTLLQSIIPYLNKFDINLFTFSNIQLARNGILQDFSEFQVGNDSITFNVNKTNALQKYLYFGYNYITLQNKEIPLISPFKNNTYLDIEKPYHEKFEFPDNYQQYYNIRDCKVEQCYDIGINKAAYHGKNMQQITYYKDDIIQIFFEIQDNFMKQINLQLEIIVLDLIYYQDVDNVNQVKDIQFENQFKFTYTQKIDKNYNSSQNSIIQLPVKKILEQINKQNEKMLFSIQNIHIQTKQNYVIQIYKNEQFRDKDTFNDLYFSIIKQKVPTLKISQTSTPVHLNQQIISLQLESDQKIKLLAQKNLRIEGEDNEYKRNEQNIKNDQLITEQVQNFSEQNQKKNVINAQINKFIHTDNQLWHLTMQGIYINSELQRPMVILYYYHLLQRQLLDSYGYGFLRPRYLINKAINGQDKIVDANELEQVYNIYNKIDAQVIYHFKIFDIKKPCNIYYIDMNDVLHKQCLNIQDLFKQQGSSELQFSGTNSVVFVKSIQNLHKFKYNLQKKEDIAQIFFISKYLIDYKITVLNNKIIIVQEIDTYQKEAQNISDSENKITYFLNNLQINLSNYNITKLHDNSKYDSFLQLSYVLADTALEQAKLQDQIRNTADFLYKTYNAAYQDSKDSENFIRRAKMKFEEDIQKIKYQFVTNSLNTQQYGYLVVVTTNNNIITKSIKLPLLQQYQIEQKYIQTRHINIKTFLIKNILSIYDPISVNISNQQVLVKFGQSKYIEVVETQADENQN